MDSKYVCPCCGYVTLDRPPGDFDTCPVCYWEADSVQSFNPRETTGPNPGSIECGRRNFLTIGTSHGNALNKVRPPLPSELPTLWSLPGKLTEPQVQTLAQEVRAKTETFNQQVSRRIGEGDYQPITAKLHHLRLELEESLRQEHGDLLDQVRVILTFHNPLDIALPSSSAYSYYRVYDSQVEGILPWLPGAESVHDVVNIVYREFRRWFVEDVVGPASRYGHLATNIWEVLPRSKRGAAT